ncbi:ABC transporter permease [Streptococcus sp. ZJ93]|uniref:ABC transporter permease n=1 Tax=Streptococcus handemini TaxID=3161188 RepID=UPI0032EFEF10
MKIIQSELLKIKMSYPSYLILGFSVVEIITILPYLIFVKSSKALEAAIFFPMLAIAVIISLTAILIYEQEEQANQFQVLISERNGPKLWAAKILILDLMLLLPTIGLWSLLYLVFKQDLFFTVGLVYWLLSVLLNHVHLLLTFLLGNSGNLIVAFIECLLIIFATNKVFLEMYWLPIALPINMILEPVDGYLVNLSILISWIVFLFLVQIFLLKYSKMRILK